jgi:hypothetical protein
MVLSIAAFGKPMSWKSEFSSSAAGEGGNKERFRKGHQMSFTKSIYTVSTHLLGALAVPSWALMLTKESRTVRRAFKELRVRRIVLPAESVADVNPGGWMYSQIYMDEMIAEGKEEYEQDPENVSKRSDLLANLIAAAAEDQGSEEIVGNPETHGLKKRSLSLNASELRG